MSALSRYGSYAACGMHTETCIYNTIRRQLVKEWRKVKGIFFIEFVHYARYNFLYSLRKKNPHVGTLNVVQV